MWVDVSKEETWHVSSILRHHATVRHLKRKLVVLPYIESDSAPTCSIAQRPRRVPSFLSPPTMPRDNSST